MMNNRITRIIANTVGLAAVAALGITVYQLGTAPVKEAPQEQTEETQQDENSIADAGTSQVESENQPLLQEDGAENTEETSGDGSTDTESFDEEDANDTSENSDTNDNSNIQDSNVSENSSGSESNENTETTNVESAVSDEIGETKDVSASAVNLPVVNFSEDTLMEWPVNGNILLDYSMDQTTYFPTLDQYKLSPAISVGAVEGAPVVAAVNGTVYSVEQNAQTGTTLTMELGNGYQAVYGQLTDLTVSEGDTVKKGTTIGYIAQPTKYYSTEGTNLYFAMRKNGEPIDPIEYLP
ncbi:M23 family peptidase [Ruminococcus sp. AF41-9]|nr:M23 family peptidase [Ruminococcus sp. AF41-9]